MASEGTAGAGAGVGLGAYAGGGMAEEGAKKSGC